MKIAGILASLAVLSCGATALAQDAPPLGSVTGFRDPTTQTYTRNAAVPGADAPAFSPAEVLQKTQRVAGPYPILEKQGRYLRIRLSPEKVVWVDQRTVFRDPKCTGCPVAEVVDCQGKIGVRGAQGCP
jgi:hypothetical protein